MIYLETSGASPDPLYVEGSFNTTPAWGVSWGLSWGRSWGFVRPRPPYPSTTGTPPDDIFVENSGSGLSLYYETTGTAPDIIYEED